MSSQIEIVNRALIKLGANTILALTDNTPEARTMSRIYDSVLNTELRAHIWQFTIKRAQLAALVDVPVYDYSYLYQIPSDSLRLIEVSNWYTVGNLQNYISYSLPDYKIEQNKIATNITAPLNIRYVSKITDTSQFDSCFVESFACKLAYECCETITQSNTKKQALADEYKKTIMDAIRCNAIETPSDDRLDDSWVMGRL